MGAAAGVAGRRARASPPPGPDKATSAIACDAASRRTVTSSCVSLASCRRRRHRDRTRLRTTRTAATAAAARGPVAALPYLTGVCAQDVLFASWQSSTYSPGHVLMLDRRAREVVLAIPVRMHDVLTDLVCEHATFSCELGDGMVHAGMLKAAERLAAP